jgi:hypothetical protein
MGTWRNRTLATLSQAGLVNNFNDGVVWGLLPLLLAARGLGLADIGLIAGLYPLTWDCVSARPGGFRTMSVANR